ncbi:MAG: aspartyl/asparaginyl beta-hydroxylase domain-containing protein [Acidimicrobiales bacterium]
MSETVRQLRKTVFESSERLLYGVEKVFLRASTVPTTPFLDPADFPWTSILEDGWKDMRADLDELLRHRSDLPNIQEITPDVGPLSVDDQWKSFFFMGYGFRSEKARARCPRSAALLDQIPGLTTAFFSILMPGKHIDPHRGPYRGVVRYHLALRVPEPPESCGIEVDGETRHWQEGKSLMFDDGYRHKAWNDSDEIRVVLFADVVRPMRRPVSDINQALIRGIAWTPFVQDAKRRHQAWERRYESLGY